MIVEYKYRPPIKHLFAGLAGLILFIIFGLGAIKGKGIWVSIISGIFSLMGLVMGIAFLILFIRKFNVGNLKLGNEFLEIPGRWKERIKINFKDILEIRVFDTYDNVIEIISKYGVHLIERNWMNLKDFEKVKKKLQEYRTNKQC